MIVVVAGAVIRDGRVLAARRRGPGPLGGGWEFPGGKVEDGETEARGLARELAEELGVRVRVGARLGAADDGRIRIVLYTAALDGAEPVAGADHDMLRWPAADELDGLGWLPIDRELLDLVRPLLSDG